MKLKQYQADTLAVLRRFFEDARIAGPKNAYEAIVKEPGQAKRLGRYAGDYRPLAAIPGPPSGCLWLPTIGRAACRAEVWTYGSVLGMAEEDKYKKRNK